MRRQTKKVLPVLWLVFSICLVWCAVLPASAENAQKVADGADLLEEDQEERLQEQFTKIAEKYACDVAVVTTDSCGGKSPQDYTDEYYRQNGYGYGENRDGIILMVSMGERKFHLATRGTAVTVFTDYGLQRIDDMISGDLSDGEYYEAFRTFGELTEEFILEAEKGKPFDVHHEYKEKMGTGLRILIAFIAAAIVTSGVFLILIRQLKSVGTKKMAQEYVRPGSFQVTYQRDIFLYRTVSRVRKENHQGGGGGSTTHAAPGGGRAGGHTGSF